MKKIRKSSEDETKFSKEDFVNEIFMNGISISLFALPFKDLLVNIGENEERRQYAIRYLKDLCSNTNFLLNGLRSEDDFARYSRDYNESRRRWLTFLKENGIDNEEKMKEFFELVKNFVSMFEKPSR